MKIGWCSVDADSTVSCQRQLRGGAVLQWAHLQEHRLSLASSCRLRRSIESCPHTLSEACGVVPADSRPLEYNRFESGGVLRSVPVVILLAVLALASAGAAADEALPYVIGEWPPYTSESLDGYGFMAKIATAVAREMGMTPTFTFQPWVRSEERVRAGKAFATFPYAITDKRRQDFDFIDPVITSNHLFFYNRRILQTAPSYEKLKDLRSFRVGGIRGYYYTDPLAQAGVKVDFVPEDEQNLMKLHAGRIDLAVFDSVLGWTLIKKIYPNEIGDFATLPKPLSVTQMSFMISRTYPGAAQLREKMRQAWHRIKNRDDIRALFQQHAPGSEVSEVESPLRKGDRKAR